ncbi:MAG TPA: TMEM143 family protein [Xanthobacteraceae bacterium]|nr:TMEM143 family protein [Xanthobacteraceae bacterium]
MTSTKTDRRRAEAADDRNHFIAVRKTDILDALIEHGRLADEAQRESFRQVCRRLGAIYHYEYFAQLERLRDDYFYLNPEIEPHARLDAAALERAYTELVNSFTTVLADANFVEMSHAEIEEAHRRRSALRIDIEAPLDDFREVRFFRRGHHAETVDIAGWLGLRKQSKQVLVYDDIVLLVAMKPQADIVSRRQRKRLALRKIRPGSVLIKYFRNIAGEDLNALFPNVRVVLSMRDKLLLSGPALAGGLPILLKLASTITVLFLVVGFYFGLSANVADKDMAGALAAVSGLVALGGFIMRQWLRYQRQSLKYQKELTENVYFRNVNNNAGIFDGMIGAAEDQECKEAFLAYYFLCTAERAPNEAELEERIESWLAQAFGVAVGFKVGEALARLDTLGLLLRNGAQLSVLPLEAALPKLDGVWSDFFKRAVD